MSSSNIVFIYGTVKRTHRNHYIFADKANGKAEFICEAKLIDPYPLVVLHDVIDVSGPIPAILPKMPSDKPPNIVHGELYKVDSSLLNFLDEFECHPTWYIRKLIQCVLTSQPSVDSLTLGNIVDCHIYFYNQVTPEMYSLPYTDNYKE